MAEIQLRGGRSIPLGDLAAEFHDTAVWNVRKSSKHPGGMGYILAGAYLRQFDIVAMDNGASRSELSPRRT
jgi:hypothetical protein